jgi:hypothetical protein
MTTINDFQVWLANYGTPDMTSLSIDVANEVTGIINDNQTTFDDAGYSFWGHYNNLTSQELSDLTSAWF